MGPNECAGVAVAAGVGQGMGVDGRERAGACVDAARWIGEGVESGRKAWMCKRGRWVRVRMDEVAGVNLGRYGV